MIASANLSTLKDQTMALSIYLHSFCAVISILGLICCLFCIAVWKLLKSD